MTSAVDRVASFARHLGQRSAKRAFPFSAPEWPASIEREAPERRVGVSFETAWARSYPARLARAAITDFVTRPLMTAVATPGVSGLERIAHIDAPVIFVANHMSHVDTPLILSCLPRRLRHKTIVAAAADYFFDRRWKAAVWAVALGAVPMERIRVSRRSADLAATLLGEGWNLVVFPEGGRSPDGWGRAFRGGAAYLSVRTQAPVVPVHLAGTRAILAKGSHRLRPASTTVTFGTPIRPADGEDARHLAARIESAVDRLADAAGPDWWTAHLRAARGETPSLMGPPTAPWRRSWALETSGRTRAGDDTSPWSRR